MLVPPGQPDELSGNVSLCCSGAGLGWVKAQELFGFSMGRFATLLKTLTTSCGHTCASLVIVFSCQ